MIDRRSLFSGALATGALAATGFAPSEVAAEGLRFGPAVPFTFERLKERARDMARAPYVAPARGATEILEQID
jgi:glucans biosynthesis protein